MAAVGGFVTVLIQRAKIHRLALKNLARSSRSPKGPDLYDHALQPSLIPM